MLANNLKEINSNITA